MHGIVWFCACDLYGGRISANPGVRSSVPAVFPLLVLALLTSTYDLLGRGVGCMGQEKATLSLKELLACL